ncbi:MAG: ligand-binding SRPBCC domain-containing protein [Cyclobacteriaceae bacterium]|jgi:ligand-binding SRPBCC domain-containing protein
MKIRIETKLNASSKNVYAQFNEQLFTALNPPFPKVDLKRFDGSKTGDIVSLQLNFLLFKQDWTSEIIEDNNNGSDYYFIDKGIKLPFFLSFWIHRHEINSSQEGSTIVDDIEYKTGTLITDLLMYPAMYFQFSARKPIYKKYFNQK